MFLEADFESEFDVKSVEDLYEDLMSYEPITPSVPSSMTKRFNYSTDLYRWACEIVSGMDFLASKKVRIGFFSKYG